MTKHKKISVFAIFFCLLLAMSAFFGACAKEEEPTSSAQDFQLISGGKAAIICVEGTNMIGSTDGDYPGVIRAAYDLQSDVEQITGKKPVVTQKIGGYADYAIIIGTLGKSDAIERIAKNGKIDVSGIKGKWESYIVQTVQDPFNDGTVKTALVIAGSDKRGSIYGIYSVSEELGMSPWHFFADSVPESKENYVFASDYKTVGEEPSVKYRGIFINDEEDLESWARALDEGKHLGPKLYEKIFEALLRMKANYLWPGMHLCSDAFSDYEENPVNADYYGIVIGTSHCDMLLRNNINEWDNFKQEYVEAHPELGLSVDEIEYDYTVNPEIVQEYWRISVRENKDYEVQWTLGMRGAHDEGFNSKNIDQAPYYGDKCALMKQIFEDQRNILREELNNPTLENVFMMFIPYKEVQQIYNDGLEVPEDITIMWADDNHGFIRNLPNEEERERSGGHGIYYHNSYWGPDNESYMWLNSMPLTLVYEEMGKALEYGVNTAWILNSGDTANYMMEIGFFADFAYNADAYSHDTVYEVYMNKVVSREFGEEFNDEITEIYKTYTQMTNSRKLEQMSVDLFSSAYSDESEKRAAQYKALWEKAEDIYNRIPARQRDCYYETILFEIRCAYYINAEFYYAHKGNVAYEQGRNATAYNCYLHSKQFNQMRKDEISYYNNILQDGKWKNLINPEVYTNPVMSGFANGGATFAMGPAEAGVIVEGEAQETEYSTLIFGNYAQGRKYIDVFNKGAGEFKFSVSTDASFITVEAEDDTVTDEQRLWVEIDWDRVTKNSAGTITLTAGDYTKQITVKVRKESYDLGEKTYVEQDGYVSIEAEHYSDARTTSVASWEVIKDLGRGSGDMVRAETSTLVGYGEKSFQAEAPYLEYRVYFLDTGAFETEIYRLPSLSSLGRIRFAVAVNDGTPIIVEGERDYGTNNPNWEEGVFTQIIKHKVTLDIVKEGLNTIRIYMLDPFITIDKLVVYTTDKQDSYFGPAESYNTTYNTDPGAATVYERFYQSEYSLPASYDITRDYGNGAFVELNGKLSIEAETAALEADGAYVTNGGWIPARTIEGISMRTVNNRDSFVGRYDVAPTLNYEIVVTTAGKYNVWVNANSPMPSSSEFAIGIDGSYKYISNGLFSYGREEQFVWWQMKTTGSKNVQLDLSAGTHTIQIYCGEDGVSIEKIYLTTGSETPNSASFVQSPRTMVTGTAAEIRADANLRQTLRTAITSVGNFYNIVAGEGLGEYGAQETQTLLSAIDAAYDLLNADGALNGETVATAVADLNAAYTALVGSRNVMGDGITYLLYEDYDSMITGLTPFGFEYEEVYLSPDISVSEGENGEKFFNIRTFNEHSYTEKAFVRYDIDAQSKTLTVEARMSFNEAEWGSFYLLNESGKNAVCIAFEYAYNEYNIVAYNKGVKTVIAGYERNVPVTVKIVADIENNEFDVYLDGVLAAEDFSFRSGTDSITAVLFGASTRDADLRMYELKAYAE